MATSIFKLENASDQLSLSLIANVNPTLCGLSEAIFTITLIINEAITD
jgi:hypothetical protein